MKLGEKIKLVRKQRGMTQRELGERLHQAVTKMLSQPFFFVVTPKNGDFDVLFSRSYFTRLSNRFMAVGLFCCRFSTAVRPHCGKNERICR
ncbi:MAG: helix-turn-helix transcriptional regulator [Subdoligranulum variabile]|nr:helix-turn-helix transcriptional regulator [Subdoligranulum variabile]